MGPRLWTVDLTDSEPGRSRDDLPKPLGYSELSLQDHEHKVESRKADQAKLKLKKASELGWSPAKSFFMTAFMLWMSGSGVHIFSIMITFQAMYGPVKQLLSVNTVFAQFNDPSFGAPERAYLLTSKLTFFAMNLVALSAGLYKMSCMGMLPTTSSDWVNFLSVAPNVQFSSGSSA